MRRIKQLFLAGLFCVLFLLTIVGYLCYESRISLIIFVVLSGIVVYLVTNVSHQSSVVAKLRGLIYSLFMFHNTPKRLAIYNNTKIFHPKRISIGNNCTILDGAVLAPLCRHQDKEYPSHITIGNNVSFGANDRIASMNSVTIEDDVLFAAFVHVTDHSHEFRDAGKPISQQSVYSKGPVVIKKGCWLAFGCHVLSGVTIGEYSVVAANSVVTKDVPPYTVVAGNPARIVSQYDFVAQKWVGVKE